MFYFKNQAVKFTQKKKPFRCVALKSYKDFKLLKNLLF